MKIYRDEFQPDFMEFYLLDMAAFHNLYAGQLEDDAIQKNMYPQWPSSAVSNNLWLAPGVIGVRSFPDLNVKVVVQVAVTSAPDDEQGYWRACSQCQLAVTIGKLALSYYGVASYALLGSITIGLYQARIYYGDQSTLHQTGDYSSVHDYYKIALWR
jgi:hypothetical protein